MPTRSPALYRIFATARTVVVRGIGKESLACYPYLSGFDTQHREVSRKRDIPFSTVFLTHSVFIPRYSIYAAGTLW